MSHAIQAHSENVKFRVRLSEMYKRPWRTYGGYFPSDRETLLYKCLVVKNILVRRKSHDSSSCFMAKYGRELLEFVNSRAIICINEVDTEVIDLNQIINHAEHRTPNIIAYGYLNDEMVWIYFRKGERCFLNDINATILKNEESIFNH